LRKPTGQSRIDNPDTLSILGTQDTRRRQTNQNESKKQNIAQKYKKVTTTDPTKDVEVNPGVREG
jgi:hypothetical protein